MEYKKLKEEIQGEFKSLMKFQDEGREPTFIKPEEHR